jgi:hypothetical protein
LQSCLLMANIGKKTFNKSLKKEASHCEASFLRCY